MKYCEKTLRNRAHKIGYQISKGFQHFGENVFYDYFDKRHIGYMVKDMSTGCYVWGCYNSNLDYLWTLQDVENYLKKQYEAIGLKW